MHTHTHARTHAHTHACTHAHTQIDLLSELSFTINEGGLVGNEGQFNVDLEITIDTGNANDTDTPLNNRRNIAFNVVASTAITVFS